MNIIGALMLISLFIAMVVFIYVEDGLKATLQVIGIVTALLIWITVSCILLYM